ncbi:hypothetical protein HDV01_004020 [Terramyces sp. JEL0728]|nr:hypothetical protein HDV01_004020 [Terramyces sp. JEL0728]
MTTKVTLSKDEFKYHRSIILFPKFANQDIIDKIRCKYDPLAHNIQPHITLVFPFKSNIERDVLAGHIERVLADVKPFDIKLQEFTGTGFDSKFFFLNVKKGNDSLISLHDKLYSELLAPYLDQRFHFTPHLTVGNTAKVKEMLEECKDLQNIEFSCTISEVYVELIDKNDNSIIEINSTLD